MKGVFQKPGWGSRLLSLVLCMALLSTCLSVGGTAAFAREETLSFDIGVSPECVTATLNPDGSLVLSGAGEVKDYTPETAPFVSVQERITSVEIHGGVASLGDYLFYNCGNLTGTVDFPAGLVRLGDYVFSGDSEVTAPHPRLVMSRFTEATISKRADELTSPAPSSEPSPFPEPTVEPDSSSEPTTEPTTEPAPSLEPTVEPTLEPASPEENGSQENNAATSLPGSLMACPGFLAVQALTAFSSLLEETASQTSEPTEEPAPEPVEEPSPEPTEAPSTEPSTESSPEASAQPSPESSLSPEPTEAPEFLLEELTEQQVGEEIFFPVSGENPPLYYGEPTNLSFLSAMAAAGYRRAERLEPVSLDSGEGQGGIVTQTIPVAEGSLLLPQAPSGFTPPEGGQLFSYEFGGWTESRDEADLVRRAGSAFAVGDLTDLYFIAYWSRRILVEIQMERQGDTLLFSVPEVEGWEFTRAQWQECQLPPGEEVPVNEDSLLWTDIPQARELTYSREIQPGDENRLFRCVVVAEQKSLLRSVFSLFGAAGEELALPSVRGLASSEFALSFSPGAYTGAVLSGEMAPITKEEGEYYVIPSCGYTCSGVENLVFNGWLGSDGNSYDPGEILPLSAPLTLTAQWAVAAVVYINGTAGASTSAAGTPSSPCKYFTQTKGGIFNRQTYPGVYDKLPSDGTKYTNIIVVMGNTTLGTGGNALNSKPATITNLPPNGTKYESALSLSGKAALSADTIFRDLTLAGTSGNTNDDGQTNGIYGTGHLLQFGENVTTSGYLSVAAGGNGGTVSGNTRLIAQSGSFTNIYGGNLPSGTVNGGAQVMLSGTATARVVVGGAWYSGAVTGTGPNGYGTEVLVGGNAEVGVIGAGGRDSNSATTTNRTHTVLFENALVAQPADDTDSNSVSRGYVSGSGLDGVTSNSGGSARDGTKIEIREQATVSGGVFGGSGDAYVASSSAEAQAYNGTIGDTEVIMTGGNVSVLYGAGNNRSTQGNSTVRVSGGTILGDLCAAGSKGNLSGSATLEITGGAIEGNVYGGGIQGFVGNGSTVTITEGTIGGSVYAGGSQGNITGDATLTMEGGAVSGNVFGGGYEGTVTGNSSASMSGGRVTGSLYGGGESGAVSGSASASLSGGEVSENLYGGSMGVDGDAEVGLVSGGTTVSVTGGIIGAHDNTGLLIYATGNAVGGGRFSRVGGEAAVVLASPDNSEGYPAIGDSIYGGGYYAPVGSALVQVESGTVGGHVYGAGFGSLQATVSKARVEVNGGQIKGNVYGGGRLGTVTGDVYLSLAGGSVQGSVFGAGSGKSLSAEEEPTMLSGCVYGSTQVILQSGTVSGNVFGGGDLGCVGTGTITGSGAEITSTADTVSSTSVVLQGTRVSGSVFGGGSGSGSNAQFGTVFGGSSLTVKAGEIGGSLFGGSNRSYVTGDVQLLVDGSVGAVSIGDTVYAGGNLSDGTDPTFNENTYLVLGSTEIQLDGSSKNVTIGGSVFGSGNLTLVKGESIVSFVKFAGAVQSVQRADRVDLHSSELVLQGANDVTEAVVRAYSISKVDDLRLIDSSMVNVNKEVRELGALGNYVTSGATVSPSTAEAGRSTLQIYQGRMIQIKKDDVYGDVSGVLWLDIHTDGDSGEFGVSIQASLNSDMGGGDEATGTGAFVKKETPASAGLKLVSGQVEGAYRFWRLGGQASQVDLSIQAIHGKNGGTGRVTQDFELPTYAGSTIYVASEMKILSGDFSLIYPQGTALTGDGVYGLSLGAVADAGWSQVGDDLYFLSQLPSGETQWNSGVPGVWKAGNTDSVTTASGGNAGARFTLEYKPTYESFSGGEVQITLKEYRIGREISPETLENTVVINLTVSGEEGEVGGHLATVAAGRNFSEFAGESASITENGGVSAYFVTDYYPEAVGSDNMALSLYKISGDTAAPVAFPDGTRVVLGDWSVQGQRAYYFMAASGSSLPLSDFSGMGGYSTAYYPGPGSVVAKITEKLLFAVDFSQVSANALPAGSYVLHLSHTPAENTGELAVSRGAKFQVASSVKPSLAMTVRPGENRLFTLSLTPSVDEADTRYVDGAVLRLALWDSAGAAKHIPASVAIAGGESVMWDSSGEVSFTTAKSGTAEITLDFSAVSEEELPSGDYTLSAELWPKPGLQLGSNGGQPDYTTPAQGITLEAAPEESVRGILATLSDHSQRLVDTSEGPALLEFTLQLQKEAADTVAAVIYEKTGSTPEEESYVPYSEMGVMTEGTTAIVTVPQNTPAGTYRVVFQVKNPSGTVVADHAYNFIVKE